MCAVQVHPRRPRPRVNQHVTRHPARVRQQQASVPVVSSAECGISGSGSAESGEQRRKWYRRKWQSKMGEQGRKQFFRKRCTAQKVESCVYFSTSRTAPLWPPIDHTQAVQYRRCHTFTFHHMLRWEGALGKQPAAVGRSPWQAARMLPLFC